MVRNGRVWLRGSCWFVAAVGLLLLGTGMAVGGEKVLRVHEVAAAGQRPAGAPELSEVCFSSRWKHPRNGDDPHDSFRAAAGFHATRFVWVYTQDKGFIGRAKELGYGFHCALNSMIADWPEGGRTRGRIQDLDGKLVTAPWMRTWKDPAWGCVNSPQWRASYLAFARKCIDAGTDGFQMDDPPINLAAVNWGGCFCDHCMAGFRDYVRRHTGAQKQKELGIGNVKTFDYRVRLKRAKAPAGDAFSKWDGGELKRLFVAFQRESVRCFYGYVRDEIDNYAGRHVPFSSNNYDGRWVLPYDLFEYGMAELPARSATPDILYGKFREARRRGKAQVFTFVSKDTDLTRKVIATCYACGGHLIVPWDVYMGSGPRHFGKESDYADLYKFVREHARFFDGYADAATVAGGLKDERYGDRQPVEIAGGSGGVCAFVRAVPGNANAPVVIHVIDWGKEADGCKLVLRNGRFFDCEKLAVRLHRPGETDLPLKTTVKKGSTIVELPPLRPWGMVIVEAGTGGG